jgi:hypothetical protein
LTDTRLSQTSRKAIAACVRSIEEFEILVYLARNRDRYCSAEGIAAEIGLPARLVAPGLEALASRSLLAVRIAGAVLYKLDPTPVERSACVEEVLAAGRRNRAAVMKAILATASAAQDFADAFRVDRKHDSDG